VSALVDDQGAGDAVQLVADESDPEYVPVDLAAKPKPV